MAAVVRVLMAVALMLLLMTVAMGAMVTLAVRRVRRGYRTLRTRVLGGPASRLDLSERLRESGSVAMASVGSPAWWAVQGRRRQLWRAVTAAEHAVAVAREADAALGDLPGLVARLRVAADRVDRVLRASGRVGPLSEPDRRDCDRIVAAASDIRDAALSALRVGSHADTETVADAVRIEVTALADGARAAGR